ncbi:unnamed protein product [Fusarium graminearum]|nr:unnamed protein product [Fusarium graminearum]
MSSRAVRDRISSLKVLTCVVCSDVANLLAATDIPQAIKKACESNVSFMRIANVLRDTDQSKYGGYIIASS